MRDLSRIRKESKSKKVVAEVAGIPITADFGYIDKRGNRRNMTDLEKKFADLYLETRGNAIEAVLGAGYEIRSPNKIDVARAIAFENLSKPHIVYYLQAQLDKIGLNDENVDNQLAFLINQFSDLKTKHRSVETYYKLTGRFAPEKHLNINAPLKDILEAIAAREDSPVKRNV